MTGRTIDELSVGDAAEVSRVVTASDIAGFVDSVGDRNPIHSDPAFAAATRFREPIAPGIWTAGLISGVLGTELPGPGTLYETQELRFLRPVRVGDTITARVEVADILRERNRVRLKTTCVNQRGEEVLTGDAWVLPPKGSIVYDGHAPTLEALSRWALVPWAWTAQALSLWISWTALPSWWALVPSGDDHNAGISS
ncbi:MAG: MaoC family dehydratase [Candidatus Rokubacteria bacterium]|nr:MaoC family dehydratase [Candidatus Rokubacteria bacterium]